MDMGNSASTVSTIVTTHKELNRSIKHFNETVDYHERSFFDDCQDRYSKAQRKKQLEESYRAKLRERQERKAKILEQFIYNQRQQTNPVVEAIMSVADR